MKSVNNPIKKFEESLQANSQKITTELPWQSRMKSNSKASTHFMSEAGRPVLGQKIFSSEEALNFETYPDRSMSYGIRREGIDLPL